MAAKIENKEQAPFHLLVDEGTVTDFANLGGKLALPREFDTKQFAAAWYMKGNEVESKRGKQPLLGTKYSAPGWEVWNFPEERPTGKMDEKSGKPVMEKHPNAGKTHEVTLAGKEAGTYVLMYRSADIQEQVNQVYGQLSRERLVGEVRGQTLTLAGSPETSGMLTDDQLSQLIGAEAQNEGRDGQQTVIHSALGGNSAEHLKGRTQRVSR